MQKQDKEQFDATVGLSKTTLEQDQTQFVAKQAEDLRQFNITNQRLIDEANAGNTQAKAQLNQAWTIFEAQQKQDKAQFDATFGLTQQNQQWSQGFQTQQFDWQKQQAATQAATQQQNYLANLRAQPASWLEYSMASGQPATIQPWQLPLMPQQYGQVAAGQVIPGWQTSPVPGAANTSAGTTANQFTGTLPTLTEPSTQYKAQLSPSALQQYYGYQQMATGATPADTQYQLWSKAPPGGYNPGLTYKR